MCHPRSAARCASTWPRSTWPRLLWSGFVALIVCWLTLSIAQAAPPTQRSVWLLEGGEAAVELFECGGLLCGRIAWLRVEPPRDGGSALPDRRLCNLSVMTRLRAVGHGRWEDGSVFDPRTGRSYRFRLTVQSPDRLLAIAYLGLPALGERQLLRRVQDLPRDGWCPPAGAVEAVLASNQ